MTPKKSPHLQLFFAILLVLLVGTAGYLLLEDGWTVLDALYMTVITITTIGYGEVHNLSTASRIFTIGLIFTGLGVAAVFATQVAKMIVQSGIKNLYEKRKMNEKINNLQSHTIICGYGRIGRSISLKLFELGLDFVILDTSEEKLSEAEQRGYLTMHGDAAVDGVLLSAGIGRAEYIVLCINNDADNINISLASRELNPDIFIVARGTDPTIEYRMLRAGANTVVYPMTLGGEQIAHILARHAGVAPSDNKSTASHDVMGYSLKIFPYLEAEPLKVAEALKRTNSTKALVLHRADREDVENPNDNEVMEHGDSLLVLVRSEKCSKTNIEETVTWSEDLLLGIPSIDAEHRVLVKYAEDFHKAVNEGKEGETIARLFDRLLEYTTIHFAREEGFMQKRGYPDIEEHMKEHRRITREVMELNRDKRYVFSESVDKFLQDWIINHINHTDRKYVKFMLENKK